MSTCRLKYFSVSVTTGAGDGAEDEGILLLMEKQSKKEKDPDVQKTFKVLRLYFYGYLAC